jgi:hypothetical protein
MQISLFSLHGSNIKLDCSTDGVTDIMYRGEKPIRKVQYTC